jgi:hypothetical protein
VDWGGWIVDWEDEKASVGETTARKGSRVKTDYSIESGLILDSSSFSGIDSAGRRSFSDFR